MHIGYIVNPQKEENARFKIHPRLPRRERNAYPTRYVWKAKGEEILRKIHRAKQVLTV
ncbi:MAG: hypothetical protein AB7F94_14245 [Nitrospira sp.]